MWGLSIFAAMSVGQIAVVAWFVFRREGPIDIAATIHVVGGGLTISLSVIMGLPAVLIGWQVGNAAFLRLGAGRFRSVVLVVLAASSAVTVIRVVGG